MSQRTHQEFGAGAGDTGTAIDRSDLPIMERLWLSYRRSYKTIDLRKQLSEDRFETAEEYREMKRRVR